MKITSSLEIFNLEEWTNDCGWKSNYSWSRGLEEICLSWRNFRLSKITHQGQGAIQSLRKKKNLDSILGFITNSLGEWIWASENSITCPSPRVFICEMEAIAGLPNLTGWDGYQIRQTIWKCFVSSRRLNTCRKVKCNCPRITVFLTNSRYMSVHGMWIHKCGHIHA